MPEKSQGHQYDRVVIPNIVFLTASSKLREEPGWMRIGANFKLGNSRVFKVRSTRHCRADNKFKENLIIKKIHIRLSQHTSSFGDTMNR